MIQIPFADAPLPPGFIPPPLDWFQFAILYVSCLEAALLAMPNRWQDKVIAVAFGRLGGVIYFRIQDKKKAKQ